MTQNPCSLSREQLAEFHKSVRRDYEEMRDEYPFSHLSLPPSVPPCARIQVIAASASLIGEVRGVREDFLGAYSKKLVVKVPIDYRSIGCEVYGASWVRLTDLAREDRHFHDSCQLTKDGFRLCVGVPESFPLMDNVLLECVKTADNMLVAYERVMRGETSKLELIAYSHGLAGIREFRKDSSGYLARKGGPSRG